MINFLRKYWPWLVIFITPLVMFYPSLFGFFTNDDFFCLRISHFHSLADLASSFSLAGGPGGWGLYRPLTVQVFYSLAWTFFNLNPIYLHIVLFLLFFILIYLVYKLILLISKDKKTSLIAAFLYATSATHFGHLYFLSTQELGLAIFVLLTVIYGLKFFKDGKKIYYVFSLIAFLLSIFSKETSVITPFLLGTVIIFDKFSSKKRFDIKKFIYFLLPYLSVLAIYFYFRIFHYGFTSGDSYVWNFSISRLANTLAWYLIWSLNLPEMLVDFVGPGLHINPNLWLYWSKQMIPILILFTLEVFTFVYVFVKSLVANRKSLVLLSIFSGVWFLISIFPVAFLPLHKFTFYLTLPLIGMVFLLSHMIKDSRLRILFCTIWLILSVLTLKHTVEVSWITQGEALSRRVYNYFLQNEPNLLGKKIVFVDTPADATLPWSPTSVVRQALSEKNFFEVFFPDLAGNVSYTGKEGVIIESRRFLGY